METTPIFISTFGKKNLVGSGESPVLFCLEQEILWICTILWTNQVCLDLEGKLGMGFSNFVIRYKRKLSPRDVKVTC